MKHAWMMVAALVFSGAASAQDAKPDALVNIAEGSVQLPGGNALAAGSNAGLNEGETVQVTGTATVTYANGCQVTVQDRAYTISQASCVPSSATAGGVHKQENAYVLVGLGVAAAAAAAAGGGSDDKPSSP